MAVTTTSGAPSVIEQGNTYVFTENFDDFPITDWTAQYLLQIPGSAPYSTNAVNSNSDFQFTLNANWVPNTPPGHYSFAVYVTEMASGQRATAKQGIVQVTPDMAQQQPLSSAATMLENINSAITALTTGGFQTVTVNNVSYSRYQVAELIALRTRLQAEVIREQQAQDAFRGVSDSGMIGTRFKWP